MSNDCRIAPVLAAVVLFVPFLVCAIVSTPEQILHVFPDDAFYYLLPAWRWVQGEGISFDGINATNGFHPLHFGLTALLAVLSSTRGVLMRTTFVLHALLMSSAILLLVSVPRRLTPSLRVMALAVLGVPVLLLPAWNSVGMESAVVVLSLVLCFAALGRYLDRPESVGAGIALGAGFSLVMMARLDLVLAIPRSRASIPGISNTYTPR